MFFKIKQVFAENRPPKDSIRRFLTTEYGNYGSKYMEYLFGTNLANLFENSANFGDVIDALSISLIGILNQNFRFFFF